MMKCGSAFAMVSKLAQLFRRGRGSRRSVPTEIKLEAVLAAMTDAVVIMDRSGLFVDFNEPFARLNRFKTKDECLVALAEYPSTFEVTSSSGAIIPPEDWPIARALRGESATNVELKIFRNDTRESWVGLYNYAPIRVPDGSIVGSVLTGRDITDSRRTEESLRDLSSRLQLALTSARLGLWEWNITHNTLSWDDRMFELYGITKEKFSGDVSEWVSRLHPDDKESTIAHLYAAVRGEAIYNTQFRVIRPDGNIVYLKANGLVVRGSDGTAEKMLGVNSDITQEKLANDALHRAYSDIEAKVVERTAQLEAAKVAAENASKAKDLFLATLSHELRSPLSAILSWTQLLERGLLSPEKIQIGIRTIKESVWAQNQLIGDLLDLSRISTGKLHIDRQPIDVTDVLRAAVEAIRPNAEQRGLQIVEHIECEDVYIDADPARLKQSFWNILTNAVKFTPSGGTITVCLRCADTLDGHRAVIMFKDTGKGIKAEFIPHLFERFSQDDPSSIRVHGGMGLGLALVKSLVELQDGQISAESPGEGQGATFTLSFPLLTATRQSTMQDNVHTMCAPFANGHELQNLKILLVEDGDRTRVALAQLLAAQGAAVQAEASAKEALETFTTFRPDIIVSDIAMPQEDGHSLLRKIRALGPASGGNTPAIALTAYAEPRDREEAFASGFQDYLNKPVDAGMLASAIRKLTSASPAPPTSPPSALSHT